MSYYSQILSMAAINALFALAAYLPLINGAVVVCLGAAAGIGAIVCGLVFGLQLGPSPLALGLVCGAIAGALFMGAVGGLVRQLSGFMLALTTLAIAELVRVVVENSELLGGALGFRVSEVHASLAWPILSLSTAVMLLAVFERSTARRAITVATDDPPGARALGINPLRLRSRSIAASGLLAGLGGGLYLFNVGIYEPPGLGFEKGIQIVLFAIVGGTNSFRGSVLGAFALTILPEALRFSSGYRMLLYGATLTTMTVMRARTTRGTAGRG